MCVSVFGMGNSMTAETLHGQRCRSRLGIIHTTNNRVDVLYQTPTVSSTRSNTLLFDGSGQKEQFAGMTQNGSKSFFFLGIFMIMNIIRVALRCHEMTVSDMASTYIL